MKTYNSKANAVRAMNNFAAKVQAHLVEAELTEQGVKEWGVKFTMQHDTPADVLELIAKFEVVVQPAPVVEAPKPAKGTGLKIQKDREERNGVKRPSQGGICARLWEIFERMHKESGGIIPTPKPAKEESAKEGLDPTTTTVQLYRWREYMGF